LQFQSNFAPLSYSSSLTLSAPTATVPVRGVVASGAAWLVACQGAPTTPLQLPLSGTHHPSHGGPRVGGHEQTVAPGVHPWSPPDRTPLVNKHLGTPQPHQITTPQPHQVLPYWDWSRLYYADCLVSNPFYTRPGLTLSDCGVCENDDTLPIMADVSADVATDEFLRDDRPFVVTDAMTDWPVMNTDDFWFDNVTEVRCWWWW
ncbi:hypothetical protein FHG87_017719, partial [Trinorchestia longiramus]